MPDRQRSAKNSESFKARQYGPNVWAVYKHSPSRTSEKIGVIKYAAPVIGSWTVSGSSPYVFSVTGQTFKNGDTVMLTTGTSNLPGISANTPYVVTGASGNSFSLMPATGGGTI